MSIEFRNATLNDNQISNLNVVSTSTVHIMILAALISILAVVSLLSFKKRVRQMKLGFLNTLLIVILFVLMYYQIMEADSLLAHPIYGEYRMGFFLPLFALAFNILANYFIKKDEDMVRSADRFR